MEGGVGVEGGTRGGEGGRRDEEGEKKDEEGGKRDGERGGPRGTEPVDGCLLMMANKLETMLYRALTFFLLASHAISSCISIFLQYKYKNIVSYSLLQLC